MAYNYHFDSSLHHAKYHLPILDEMPTSIGITDRNPLIVWTDTHHYVILQIQTDGSLYISTNDNSVTHTLSHVHL